MKKTSIVSDNVVSTSNGAILGLSCLHFLISFECRPILYFVSSLEHSDSPKIISIRFYSIHARISIKIDSFDSIRPHMVVTQEVGGRGSLANGRVRCVPSYD